MKATQAIPLLLAGSLLLCGCGKSKEDAAVSATPPKPAEAANQIQQAFQSAAPQVKSQAEAYSESLRAANYEKAVQDLQTIKARANLTLDQGMVIYNSERSLEARLIAGVAAGDPNAIRAYELLKKQRRN